MFLPQEPLTAGMEGHAASGGPRRAPSVEKPVVLTPKPKPSQDKEGDLPKPRPVLSANEPDSKVAAPAPASAEPAPFPGEPLQPIRAKTSVASEADRPPSLQPAARPSPQPAAQPTLKAPGEPSVREVDWPKPEVLLAQLDEMAREPETREWASGAAKLIRALGPAMSEGTAEALPLAAKLERLCEQGNELAEKSSNPRVGSKLRRAVYSLERRLAVWKPMVRAGGLKASLREPDDDLRPLGSCLADVDSLLADSPEGRGWRRFLEWDALVKLAGDKTAGSSQARTLARRVLDRFARVPMKAQQRQFLAQGPLAVLGRELRRLSSEPVRLDEVLRHVEQFERAGTPSNARTLAKDCQSLLSSHLAQKQAIGQGLDDYYRNANIRLVMLGDLLNRFIPERAKEYGDVRDVVLGNPVRGRSLTATKVRLQLVPDPGRAHVAFDVNGSVAASTHSIAGPATFYDDSQSVYRGWKEVVIDAEGMHVHPALVGVNNDLTLRGLSTDFDELPLIGPLLIGPLAQEVARSQHEQKRCEMSSEVEEKIAARVRAQIDSEADERLAAAGARIKAALFDPMSEMSLGPTLISAETNEHRVAVRFRLASDAQLGGYTPRPQAPADSAASVQVHESAINNLLGQLELDGGTFTLPQIRERISSRLRRSDLFRGSTENDDVTIAFAPRDALQVSCREGRVILTLAVARFAKPPHSWSDFRVRVLLRPRFQGRMVELVRDDVVQLMGDRLNMRAQIALRGVFSKTFSKDRPILVMPDRVVNEPRLADLVVTQLEIDDGWIGAAMGPGRVAIKPPTSGSAPSRN
jgi:hypothetical protein